MVEDLSPLELDEEKRLAITFTHEGIGRELFPPHDNNYLTIQRIKDLEPLPLAISFSPL